MIKQVVHRPGPFKQVNKPHKIEQGKLKKRFKGKCDVKGQSIRKKHLMNREERKNQLNQIRKAKKEDAKNKRRVGLAQTPPLAVMILSLSDSIDPGTFLDEIKCCDDELSINYSRLGNCHVSSSRLKQRFTFLIPQKRDMHSIMDALKVSETLLLLHSTELPDEHTEMLLSVIVAHALPTTIHAIQGLDKLNPKKKADCRKHVLKNIESRFPDAKLHQADTRQELQLLLRQIANQKQRAISFRDARFHMLAEEAELLSVDSTLKKGTLKVSGYIRGQPLNVNSLVHIPGWGTFQMSQVSSCGDPFEAENRKKNLQWSITEEPDILKQESLQSEVEPDPMAGEQTWPTQEELDAAEMEPKKRVKKVTEGTSEYQAAWIGDSENEESECESSNESDMEDLGSNDNIQTNNDEDNVMDTDITDSDSVINMKEENYDKNMDLDEEKQTLVRFKEERMNQMFPDEQDTPIDVSARVRYQKYRGLKNFHNSPWDPMENLPRDYARIFRFQNFRQTKKKVFNSDKEGLWSETYATLFIEDVPQSLFESFDKKNSILVVYGILPHEQKMSVVNAVIRKHASCKTPVKSKDQLIFHIGFTRFSCKPILSEHKTGNKFKYERFLPSDTAVVASFFAPVIFPPASVVVFRKQQDGSQELVATGSVLNVDPNRIVVKRVLLSGHPFKIFKRSAVVRYMFFNKDDINWFKCVELYTKCGRRGHIREPLGSHGHMKCIFDEQLPSQDVVLMSLYKRVFPKWTYELHDSDENVSLAPEYNCISFTESENLLYAT